MKKTIPPSDFMTKNIKKKTHPFFENFDYDFGILGIALAKSWTS